MQVESAVRLDTMLRPSLPFSARFILGIALGGATCIALAQTKTPPDATWIEPSDSKLQYWGRVGLDDPKEACFYYSSTGVRAKFHGRSLALRFEEDNYGPANSFGVRIDGGVEIPLVLTPGLDGTYIVAAGLPDRVHSLEIYRRQDTYGGVAKFKGMWIDKGAKLENPPRLPSRKIEFFGDSVMSGAASIAFGFEQKSDPTISYANKDDFINDGYWSFGAIAARLLNADANVQGIGGLPLRDNTGWFGGPLENCIGLETTWDKLDPIPGQFKEWDFQRFVPDVVVIAVGQNDARGGDIHDPEKRTQWKSAYTKVIEGLRSHYPKAHFVLTTTVLMHDMEWDKAIQEVADEYNPKSKDKIVRYYRFTRAGKATPGHPRIQEEEEMGQELAKFIDRIPGVWRH